MKIIIIIMSLFLIGCASTGHKIDQSAVSRIQNGVTTKAEVINLIGSPEMITKKGNGDTVFVYHYIRSSVKPATFIPYIGAFVGGADTQQQMTNITFGPDGIVKDYSSTQGGMETNMNLTAGDRPNTPEIDEGKRK